MTIKLTLAQVWVDGKKYWVLQDGTGRKASAAFHTRELAELRRDQLLEADRKRRAKRKRPCMCCAREFMSEGIHNRLCNSCSSHGARTHW